MKAKFAVEGNRRLRAIAASAGIAVDPGGILVVAMNEAECATLAELEGARAPVASRPG